MKLRSKLAIFCAKLVYTISTKLKKGRGSSLPGRVAEYIDPEILTMLSGMVKEKVIVVTGTNGKTTTNGILTHVLEAHGQKVISNRLGANLPDGVVSAFVLAADRQGQIDADYACIEVDELSSEAVFSRLKPDCVIVTNIFRDQMDRIGEVDTVCKKIKKALKSVPEAELILNGDDVCSLMLADRCRNPVTTYGIDEKLAENLPAGPREIVFCPVCGTRLEYDLIQYGQLGIWHCPACGLHRPRPDISAANIDFNGGCYSFTLAGTRMTPHIQGPYNVYNTLAAYAVLWILGAPRQKFRSVVERLDYGNDRESTFTINSTHVRLFLAKNPVGFQQKLFLIQQDPNPKDVLIQINDTKLDGEDISWLWDVDYDNLADASVESVTVGGMRGSDMELCLKYEGIPCSFTTDFRSTVQELTLQGGRNLYIITNYSGLYRTNRMLRGLQSVGKGDGTYEIDNRPPVSGAV